MFKDIYVILYLLFNLTNANGINNEEQQKNVNEGMHKVNDWPKESVHFGQLSAVTLDTKGNVVVFHRGNRVWNYQTFSMLNEFNNINDGPIKVNTIITLNASNGLIINSWGKELFYLPHGLTIDHDSNIWLTDVAMHQVFKFSSTHENVLTLGTKFVPGNDLTHFCKPTSVAVMSNGDFFVADGYCNYRILKYSNDGTVIQQWGTQNFQGMYSKKLSHYTLAVPHAMALVEDENELCVADRENSRVLCYSSHNGTFIWQYQFPMDKRVFSIAHTPAQSELLYIVNGPITRTNATGIVLNMHSNQVVYEFGGFLQHPHDIAVSKDGSAVYVVELNPFTVHKFASNNTQAILECPSIWKTNRIWIITFAASFLAISLIICVAIIWYKLARRKKESSAVWKRPVSMDKVFRLDKLTERQNIGQGFQRLKTDESDEETVATVNI